MLRIERAAIIAGGMFTPGLAPDVAEAMRPVPGLEMVNPVMFKAGVKIESLLEEWDGVTPRGIEENLAFLDSVGTIFSEAVYQQPRKIFSAETKPKRKATRKRHPFKELRLMVSKLSQSPKNVYHVYDKLYLHDFHGRLVLEHEEDSTEPVSLPGGIREELHFVPGEEGKFTQFSGIIRVNPYGDPQRKPGSFSFPRDSATQVSAQKAAELTYDFARAVAGVIKRI